MDGRDNIRGFICDAQTENSGWRTDGGRTEWTLAIIELSAIELEWEGEATHPTYKTRTHEPLLALTSSLTPFTVGD